MTPDEQVRLGRTHPDCLAVPAISEDQCWAWVYRHEQCYQMHLNTHVLSLVTYCIGAKVRHILLVCHDADVPHYHTGVLATDGMSACFRSKSVKPLTQLY